MSRHLGVLPLHAAIYTRLAAAGISSTDVEGNAVSVPVYDYVPPDAAPPFVFLDDWHETGDLFKADDDDYESDLDILVDITVFTVDIGAAEAASIGNQVFESLTSSPLSITDWTESDATRETFTSERQPSASGVMFREAVLTMRYLLTRS